MDTMENTSVSENQVQVTKLRFRRDTVERLLKLTEVFTWEDMPSRDPDTGKLTTTGWINGVQNIVKYTMCVGCTVHVIQTVSRMFTSSEPMFSAWYPFDASTSPISELIMISQIIATTQWILIYYSIPCLYMILTCIVISQLEKLKQNLLEIKQMHFMKPHCTTIDVETMKTYTEDKEIMHLMQKKLNDCIRHHQQILEFMGLMEDSFTVLFSAIFLLFLIGLCISAFTIVMTLEDWIVASEPAVNYISSLVSLYIYCSFGSKLTEQAESVRDAAFGCDWVGTPVSFQRCLVFIIATCNKEFTLTAGKFAPVSNETLMNMVNQSMSFFMFLLQVKEASDGGKSVE